MEETLCMNCNGTGEIAPGVPCPDCWGTGIVEVNPQCDENV
jgi:DnaJ-class molecular chaperone